MAYYGFTFSNNYSPIYSIRFILTLFRQDTFRLCNRNNVMFLLVFFSLLLWTRNIYEEYNCYVLPLAVTILHMHKVDVLHWRIQLKRFLFVLFLNSDAYRFDATYFGFPLRNISFQLLIFIRLWIHFLLLLRLLLLMLLLTTSENFKCMNARTAYRKQVRKEQRAMYCIVSNRRHCAYIICFMLILHPNHFYLFCTHTQSTLTDIIVWAVFEKREHRTFLLNTD